ncbi:MAG: LON peptidase substrate-binding domain-containing protein [Armatimonadetes bacterium]|nr:LON peptidase substrate-binding domain-containing protein [Armatimonadota bacterium]
MRLPLMPLNTVLFPGMPMPLLIMEPRYLAMVQECLDAESPFGVALIDSGPEVGGIASPRNVGTLARIVHVAENDTLQDRALDIVVVGEDRFRIREVEIDGDLLRGVVEPYRPREEDIRVSPELCRELAQMLQEHVAAIMKLIGIPHAQIHVPEDPEPLSFMIAAHITASVQERQRLLEMLQPAERLLRERELLLEETGHYRLLLASLERAKRPESDGDSAGAFSLN